MYRVSTCSNCRFFQPTGHYQHGNCDQLKIAVESEWAACHLGLPAFDPPISDLPDAIQVLINLNRQNARSRNSLERSIVQLAIESMD